MTDSTLNAARKSTVWEYGSEFGWQPDVLLAVERPELPWNGSYTSTGRDALRALLNMGAARLGWKRLFVPSYFCVDVIDVMRESSLELCAYRDRPGSPLALPSPGRAGDVLFVSNTLGLRDMPDDYASGWSATVEDHTHDPLSPWAISSAADYCVASLRKSLPIPDGAVVWSPSGLALPRVDEPGAERKAAVLDKATAMIMKRQYLSGAITDKRRYRELSVRAERELGSFAAPEAISDLSRTLLRRMPLESWRSRRAENHALYTALLAQQTWLQVLAPKDERCCPYSFCVLAPNRGIRDALREHLIRAAIYPAILWTIAPDWGEEADRELGERMLSIPCDMRYDETDIRKVVAAIGDFASRQGRAILGTRGLG